MKITVSSLHIFAFVVSQKLKNCQPKFAVKISNWPDFGLTQYWRTLKRMLPNNSVEKHPLWSCFEIYPSIPACTVTTSPGSCTIFLHSDLYHIINMIIKQRNAWRWCYVSSIMYNRVYSETSEPTSIFIFNPSLQDNCNACVPI